MIGFLFAKSYTTSFEGATMSFAGATTSFVDALRESVTGRCLVNLLTGQDIAFVIC